MRRAGPCRQVCVLATTLSECPGREFSSGNASLFLAECVDGFS
jgi:hypothetical protein